PRQLSGILDLLLSTRGVFGIVDGIDALLVRVHPDSTWRASVDSELATLFWPNPVLARYLPNPLSMHAPQATSSTLRTLMTCRLDGPDASTVRRMLADSLAAEEKGLSGKAYIDARGLSADSEYGRYDGNLQILAHVFEDRTKIPVVLENTSKLFQP